MKIVFALTLLAVAAVTSGQDTEDADHCKDEENVEAANKAKTECLPLMFAKPEAAASLMGQADQVDLPNAEVIIHLRNKRQQGGAQNWEKNEEMKQKMEAVAECVEDRVKHTAMFQRISEKCDAEKEQHVNENLTEKQARFHCMYKMANAECPGLMAPGGGGKGGAGGRAGGGQKHRS